MLSKPKPKSDTATIALRIEEILRIRLDGAQYHDVVQYAAEKGWGLKERQLREYIARADALLVERQDKGRRKVVARHLAQRQALYARAVNAADYRTALAVLDSEAELRGLYTSEQEIRELGKLAAEQGERIRELENQLVLPSELRARLRRNSRRIDQLRAAVSATAQARLPFGIAWVKAYLPHYFPGAPADFHGELFDRLRELHLTRDSKEAVIAPREGAKSTVITLAYVLFSAMERHEPFTLILSDSAGQAQEQLGHIRHELETNETLARDYPDAAGVGPVWRQDRIELKNGAAIGALGTGGRIRGRRSRQARPSLVIFDDVENNDTITSPVKRERAWRWATREVIPAGTAGTNFLSVGSAIHREAVAVRLGQLPGWTGRTYQAVRAWPDRMDLWSEWERFATNLADPDRGATAERFYTGNRAAMDAGAVTYWPTRWPLVALMRRRAEIGSAAFDTEYQGVPSVEGLTEFPPEFFDRPELWFDDWPPELIYRVQSLDPSKGADANSGDFQAHILLGMDRNGTMYVEGVLAREIIPLMAASPLDLAAAFGPLDSLVVENNDALGMLVAAFDDAIRKRGRVVPLQSVFNTQPKVVRVRRLGLYFGRRQVRFRNTRGTRLLVDQLRDFPNAAHDDGPDALDLAVRTLELLTNPR